MKPNQPFISHLDKPNTADGRITEAARLAHEVNRAYCLATGDISQAPWDSAPDWQKDSAKDGVMAVLMNPGGAPGDSHRNWLKHKETEGWVYGEIKDPANKRHPCMVPFEDLPLEQQLKDHLFVAVVRTIFGIPG